MCGICGAIGMGQTEAAGAIVRRMMSTLVHRGPDDEGMLIAPGAAAGMRRLSIIDLPGGSQPVWNENETLAVFFNGEIYNFRDLRARLQLTGHAFRTNSDTEVIVHAYEAWGESCVEHLQGMFAFAVVEMPAGRKGRAARVFLARDPFGIKPLYYTQADGVFLFASEVRALLATGFVSARISADVLPSYLLFGSVGEPITLVDGVFSLPPGHSLMIPVDTVTKEVRPRAYWQFSSIDTKLQREDAAADSQTSAAARVRTLLEEAVRTHLTADVPVGVFLSSGIDSTALAALASRVQGRIHTFTVGFPDLAFSEAEIARRTAARLGTNHLELNLTAEEMLSRVDEAIGSFDQPSIDGINSYFVSWAAREAGLKVALSGLGSDEIFGGYSTFRATADLMLVTRAASLIPHSLRQSLLRAVEEASVLRSSPDKFRKASAAWLDSSALPHAYFFTRLLFAPEFVADATRISRDSWRTLPWWNWFASAAKEAHSMDRFNAVSWLELRSYLVNMLLRDTDAMSMHHSLEVRVPFLDSALVEYVLSLPVAQKQDATRPKSLLIQAMGDLLPKEVVHQKKRTFTFPWENWLRGPLGERVAGGLADWSPALAPHIDSSCASNIWGDFLEGRTSWSRPWSLFVLNEWVKRNIDACETHAHAAQPASAAALNVN